MAQNALTHVHPKECSLGKMIFPAIHLNFCVSLCIFIIKVVKKTAVHVHKAHVLLSMKQTKLHQVKLCILIVVKA